MSAPSAEEVAARLERVLREAVDGTTTVNNPLRSALEDVSSLRTVITRLTEKNARLREQNKRLLDQNETVEAVVDAQAAEIARLRATLDGGVRGWVTPIGDAEWRWTFQRETEEPYDWCGREPPRAVLLFTDEGGSDE